MTRPDRRAGILALVGTLALTGLGRAADEKPLEAKVRAELIKGARLYLDPDADPFNGRDAVRTLLAKLSGAGTDVLARMDLLRDAAYQGRGFLPGYRDRKWQKLEPDIEVTEGKLAVSVTRPDKLRLAFSAPKKDHTRERLAELPRPEPFPTLISLVEEKDYTGNKFPGEVVLARRYGAVPAAKELLERWLLFSPVAVRGNYIEDGNVRSLSYTSQFKDFYQRYHVDFERVVLDGDTSNVTTIAAAQPFVFAGLVLRRPLSGEPKIDPDVVVNYANVPVFVLHCTLTEAAMKAAGHPDVTLGDEVALVTWLKERRRVVPRSFSWRVKTTQQVLAQWLILDPDLNVETRTLKVEVVDTPENPNTILIEARGVLELTALLNDEIAPLDRELRIVINGKEVEKKIFPRSLEAVFDREPLEVRNSMWYGMLFPALSSRLSVPAPAAPPEAAPAAPTGPIDPEQEAKAKDWLEKAEQFVVDGNTEKAVQILEKLLDELPATTVAAKAKERLTTLKGGTEGSNAGR